MLLLSSLGLMAMSTAVAQKTTKTAAGKNFGYNIEVNFAEKVTDDYVYLAHYFGKGLPRVYRTDSAKVIDGNKAVFQSKDSILGGIYMVMYNKNAAFNQLLLDNGYKFKMNINKDGVTDFVGNDENELFEKHEKFVANMGKKRQVFIDKMKDAKTHADSTAIQKELQKLGDEDREFRNNFVKEQPKALLSTFFRAMQTPEVPEGTHYLADGKTVDSNFAYNYYKAHYWDNFDFTDNRLIHSPIYDARLDEYFNRLILPVPDTVNAEGDALLAKTRGAKELFKYTLHWLAGWTSDAKVMGLDESFVHFVEKYYMKGDAYWLDSKGLADYEKRARAIAPTVLGNKGKDLKLQDAMTLVERPLYSVKSKYTLLVFWAYDCGHCMEEIPKLAKLYNDSLKAKGVTVYTVGTKGNLTDVQKVVKEHFPKDWITGVDTKGTENYSESYDVLGTPRLYLLDEDKIIVGKQLSHETLMSVLDYVEKKKNKVVKN